MEKLTNMEDSQDKTDFNKDQANSLQNDVDRTVSKNYEQGTEDGSNDFKDKDNVKQSFTRMKTIEDYCGKKAKKSVFNVEPVIQQEMGVQEKENIQNVF